MSYEICKILYSLNRKYKSTVSGKRNKQTYLRTTPFFYKQSIFDPRPENCLSFSKKSPQKIV